MWAPNAVDEVDSERSTLIYDMISASKYQNSHMINSNNKFPIVFLHVLNSCLVDLYAKYVDVQEG